VHGEETEGVGPIPMSFSIGGKPGNVTCSLCADNGAETRAAARSVLTLLEQRGPDDGEDARWVGEQIEHIRAHLQTGEGPVTHDFVYIVEHEGRGSRWYCGEYAPGFDALDEAAAWGLAHARTVVVRTLAAHRYWAGDPPSEEDQDAMKHWPPSAMERQEIDAAYDAALQEIAAWEAARNTYLESREEWLRANFSEHAGTEPGHSCWIDLPGEDEGSIQFEEFVPSAVCAAWRHDGPIAFGTAPEVIAATSGRPETDPWVRAVCAALERERSWAGLARRGSLDVRIGHGEMFHVAASANRGSIREHGLDWRRMRGPGIAGNEEPELPGIFLCTSLEDAEFFVSMAGRRGSEIDTWAVRVDGLVIENAPNGWWIVSESLGPERLRLEARRPNCSPRPVSDADLT
jgi:hypothetical protein